MGEKNKPDQYVEYLNSHILTHIDYGKLQESYNTDIAYAKAILNRLHEAMVSVYGGELLDETDGDEGIVVIPGVIRGKENGKLCLALLDLDLSSSGEHWGTAFLCKSGVISQNEAFSNKAGASELREAIKTYMPYDYCYTAVIPNDIHIDTMRLPVELVSVLADFRNHKAVQLTEDEPFTNIVEERPRITPATHLPKGWEWRIYDDGSGGLYSPENKRVVEVDFATSEYRREGKWHFIDGYPYDTVSAAEFMDSMEKCICGSLERGEKQSVIDKIREAAKEPPKPRENITQRDKSQPEH